MPPSIFKVTKNDPIFIDWREDVANGAPHPMQLRTDEYIRVKIGMMRIDTSFNQLRPSEFGINLMEELEGVDSEALKDFLQRPSVAWAVDLSFDGLYIKKDFNHAEMNAIYAFFVFLKREQATFWSLKYSGVNT